MHWRKMLSTPAYSCRPRRRFGSTCPPTATPSRPESRIPAPEFPQSCSNSFFAPSLPPNRKAPDSAWPRAAPSSKRTTERWGSRICPPGAAAFGFAYRSHELIGVLMAIINDKNIAPVIYVVDDDDGMRRALDTLLSTVGYRTAVYSRPSEFLANFKPDTAGCLVLDIRMPDMRGLELQQHLNHRAGSNFV